VAYEIEIALRRSGYPDALVTYSMYEDSGEGSVELFRAGDWDRVSRVQLSIRPGERVFVGRVRVVGISAFSRERVRAFFPVSTESDPTPYRRGDFEAGMQTLVRLYELNGYARVTVGPMSITPRRDTERLFYDVDIPVVEGTSFVIADVRIEAPELSAARLAELRREVEALMGHAYVPRRVAEGAVTLRNALGRRGYVAEITHEVEFSPAAWPEAAPGATVRYRITAGPQLVVDAVRVLPRDQESLRTRERFARSFISLESGDRLNLDMLNQAESDLYSLGLFSFVEVETESGLSASPLSASALAREAASKDSGPRNDGDEDRYGTDDGVVPTDVVMLLTETDSREVELSVGWGSYELAMASASFSDRNVFGIGRRWATTLHGSFKSYGVETSLSDSVLLGPASTLSLTGSYAFRDAPAYDLTTVESRLEAVFRLSSVWLLEASYSFGADTIREAVQEEELPSAGRYRAASLRAGVSRDRRDSIVLPSDGSRVALSSQYASPLIGSELHYFEATAHGAYHRTVAPRIVLTLAGTARTREPLGEDDTLPIQERLFLGGENSVRSFGRDQLGPTGATGDIIGGLTALEATAELSLRTAGSFYTAVFYDVGMVSLEPFSLDGGIGQAVGLGLRYHMPVGPIRLDFGYNPADRLGAERPWALHFAIGFSY
jgi:outer membrane protein assembly factor BamA